jgi:guanine nucleotide-binding protein G(i) subunit alpha
MSFGTLVVNEQREKSGSKVGIYCLILVFAKTDILIYLISLSDYTETIFEDNKNRMQEAVETFESTIKGEWFQRVPTIILWNKSEKLRENIIKEDRLKETFPEYKGGKNYENALHFIQSLFMEKVKSDEYFQVVGSAIDDHTILDVFRIIQDVNANKDLTPQERAKQKE